MAAFQEIKVRKRSLREVLPKSPSAASGGRVRAARKVRVAPTTIFKPPKRRRSVAPIIAALIVVLGGVWYVSLRWAEATVVIIPLQKKVPVAVNLTATKRAAGMSGLAFDLMTIGPIQLSQRLKASGRQTVTRKASGQIVIANNYSSQPQRLVVGTRFEAPNGKVYRINQGVSVPGQGTLEVTIYADGSGESYNQSALVNFTLPGLKGSPRYSKVTARAKTSITGGFRGEVPTVSAADRVMVRTSLRQAILAKAGREARFQTPDDFMLYDQALLLAASDDAETPTLVGSDTAEITMTAKAQGIIFNKKELAARLVNLDGDYVVSNLNDLKFTLANRDRLDPNSLRTINFSLNGEAEVVYTLDLAKLPQELAGKSRDEALNFFKSVPAVSSAGITFQPVWARSLPADPARIHIRLDQRS